MNSPTKITRVLLADVSVATNDRTVFNDHALARLAASLDKNGLAQPITVRPVDGGYELVAGERRTRAALLLGWEHIDALVRPMSDHEASAIMLTENTSREDLDPIDEGTAYANRVADGWTMLEIAEAAGVSQARVRARIDLLDLIPEAQAHVRSGLLSLGWTNRLRTLGPARQQVAVRALGTNEMTFAAWQQFLHTLRENEASEPMFDPDTFFVAEEVKIAQQSARPWSRKDVASALADLVDALAGNGDVDAAFAHATVVSNAERNRG